MRTGRRIASAAVTLCAALALVLTFGAPATATAGNAIPVRIHANTSGLTAFARPAGHGVTPADFGTITCTPNVQNPHNSSHVGGTVNVVATVSCTAPIGGMAITVALFLDGGLVAAGSATKGPGASDIQANAAAPCVAGVYTGGVAVTAYAPPGYDPPVASGVFYGASVSITC